LTAYVLVFLHASLAAFFLNAGFAHAQHTIQASESVQKQEKPQISLTSAERAWLAQNHTVRVRVTSYPPFMFVDADGPKGISIDYLKLIFERTGITYEFRVETRPFSEALKSFKALKGPDLLPTIVPAIKREPYVAFTKIYYSSPRVIFTRDDADFVSNLEDLTNKTIAHGRKHYSVDLLKAQYPDIRILGLDHRLVRFLLYKEFRSRLSFRAEREICGAQDFSLRSK
jgi:ABC-type amino acid transport substrate-binding protein